MTMRLSLLLLLWTGRAYYATTQLQIAMMVIIISLRKSQFINYLTLVNSNYHVRHFCIWNARLTIYYGIPTSKKTLSLLLSCWIPDSKSVNFHFVFIGLVMEFLLHTHYNSNTVFTNIA